MKNVECLLSGIKVVERKGAVVIEVSGVESDSRQVKKDNLFVAVRGASVDGHDFIGQAIAQGAVVVVCEEFPEKSEPSFVCESGRQCGRIRFVGSGMVWKSFERVGTGGCHRDEREDDYGDIAV